AGRIERLQDFQHRLDLGGRRAELLAHRGEGAVEIAGVVDEIDQVLADHAPRRIRNSERELLGEGIGERDLGRHERLEIVGAAIAPAAAGAGPFRIASRRLAVGARARGIGIGRWHIVEVGGAALARLAIAAFGAGLAPVALTRPTAYWRAIVLGRAPL